LFFSISAPLRCQTLSYAYDALGRLRSATYPDGSCTAYSYDAAGNRTSYGSGTTLAPTAVGISLTVYESGAATFDPRVNNPACPAPTITAIGSPGHGTASIGGGGVSITYTPTSGYTGTDSFSYTLSSSVGAANGTIAITVVAPTLAPTANSGFIGIRDKIAHGQSVTPAGSTDVAAITSTPYGYPLTITSYSQGAMGTVTVSGTTVEYTYNSSVSMDLFTQDSFSYTVSDGHGHTASGSIMVSINVISSN
jgi:YD repeat-containing protein